MSNAKIISVNTDSLIQVTFDNGLDDPFFTIEGLHVDGGGEEYSQVAYLKACAKLFSDKAESLEAEFEKIRNEGLIK